MVNRCRAGTPKDVASLCELTHECFPASLKWSPASDYSDNWWRCAISSADVEVIVMEDQSGIVGFSVLLFDEEKWEAILKPIRVNLKWKRVFLALVVFLSYRFQRVLAQKVDLPVDREARKLLPVERAFVALTGVSPRARRQGVGKKMAQSAIDLAKKRNVLGIQQRVDKANLANLRLLLEMGYQVVSADKKQYTLLRRF